MGLAVLSAACVLSACGGGATKSVPGANGAPHDGSSSTSPPGRPLASAQSSFDGDGVRLDILQLVRSGSVANLTISLTNTNTSATNPSRSNLQVGVLFEGDQGTPGNPHDLATMNGVLLVDPTHAQEYSVALDAKGFCVCTGVGFDNDLGNAFVPAGQSVQLSASFAAPPPDVSQVDVAVPNFGTFHGVPISSGPELPTANELRPASQLPVYDLDLGVATVNLRTDTIGKQVKIHLNADVLFAFNQARLSPRANGAIAAVAARLRSAQHPAGIHVDGYTDSIGSPSYNLGLSIRRAQAVAGALRRLLGGSAPQMSVGGHGASDPVAGNTNPDGSDNPRGRALNRRVDISFGG